MYKHVRQEKRQRFQPPIVGLFSAYSRITPTSPLSNMHLQTPKLFLLGMLASNSLTHYASPHEHGFISPKSSSLSPASTIPHMVPSARTHAKQPNSCANSTAARVRGRADAQPTGVMRSLKTLEMGKEHGVWERPVLRHIETGRGGHRIADSDHHREASSKG